MADEWKQYLTFYLGADTFGMNILHVKEIIEYGGVTPIPMLPIFILGVINIRGMAVPVVDLANRLHKDREEISRKTCIIIVDVDAQDANGQDEFIEIGLMVDGVDEVMDVPAQEVEPPPKMGSSIHTEFIEGMAKINDQFAVLLQPQYLLSIKEIDMLQQAREKPRAQASQQEAV